MRVYKLTDERAQTFGGTQWGPGITHTATSTVKALCTDGWIHAYEDKHVAALMNPAHGNFINPICWIAEGHGEPLRDGQIKLGFRSLRTIKPTSLPSYSTAQRVAFAIYCALEVCKEPSFAQWAQGWLSGADRSARAAGAAADAAQAECVARVAAYAARAASWAAEYAARAVAGAAEYAAARVAAWAAEAASWTATGAAEAALWAAKTTHIDLPVLARKAYRFEWKAR